MKKNKIRTIIVLVFLVLFFIATYISIKGEYLETLEIGKKYVEVFKQNIKWKAYILIINFCVLFLSFFVTTKITQKGLAEFFKEEKREVPKLPNKSISLIISIIISTFMLNEITQKVMLALNSASFEIADPIFNMDISYYMFQKPFMEFIITYFIGLLIALTVYVTAYYIISFNIYFDKGISTETLKKNLFLKQIVANILIVTVLVSILTIIKNQNILFETFLNLNTESKISLYGAGIADISIKLWGYRIFAVLIVLAIFMASKYIKKGCSKKVILWLASIPTYLVTLFIVLIGFNLLFVNSSELDKQKKYIAYNIENTKNAYNIKIEEVEVENSGTVTLEQIEKNENVVKNINLVSEEATLETLKEYQTNLGYYAYDNTKVGLYNINKNKELVYITPREIVTNETRTYNSKMYQYTHGFGTIITSATNLDEAGKLEYIQKDFEGSQNKIKIAEPRIYFGLATNETIVTNTNNTEEYDYPISTTKNSTNTYNGAGGINLNFLDRMILAIKQKNFKLIFANNITSNSKILTNRNVIDRAKKIMPHLIYDEEPYLVVADNGNLVWILDAYTVSENYPYSQKSTIEIGETKTKINYIRNSVKVLIDAYNGNVEFYITDRSDPIIMTYRNIYPNLFMNLEVDIPREISEHILYSQFLYNIQAEMLTKYHNMQTEVLYRGDDVWSFAKHNNSTKLSATASTYIKPYYTMLKTIDNENSYLGLIVPYTPLSKQNIVSYLVGSYSVEDKEKLTLYTFSTGSSVLGTMQLDTQIEQDETISQTLASLNTIGTKLVREVLVIPINNTLLYVEPIYQVMINESNIPILKKVIIASGTKVAIGNNVKETLENLLSQDAVEIDIENTENVEDLINEIIKANQNLNESNISNDWSLIGNDINKLQALIDKLQLLVEKENNVEKSTNTIIENEQL